MVARDVKIPVWRSVTPVISSAPVLFVAIKLIKLSRDKLHLSSNIKPD